MQPFCRPLYFTERCAKEYVDLMSRHMLPYMSKFTRILFHLVVLCDSLRCGAYGTYCYGIS